MVHLVRYSESNSGTSEYSCLYIEDEGHKTYGTLHSFYNIYISHFIKTQWDYCDSE